MLTWEQAEELVLKAANGYQVHQENYREIALRVHPFEKQVLLPPMTHDAKQELLLASYCLPERHEMYRA